MKKAIYVVLVSILLFGCSKQGLDATDVDEITQDKVFSDVELTRKALYELYGCMREVTSSNNGSFERLFNSTIAVGMLDNVTDDGAGSVARTMGVIAPMQVYLTGAVTATTNPVVDTHPWRFYYMNIRSANIFLANVQKSPLSEAEKVSSANQARFLRALWYHELFRWFGPLVISTEPTDPFAFSDTRRETLKNTVDFIVSEFDTLSREGVLPDRWEGADYGRVTRSAAMAFKARTLLYAASPLFQSSGVTWQQAADATLELIDYADSKGIHSLYYDATTPSKSYSRYFNERKNDENILVYLRAPTNDLYQLFPAFNPWNVNKEIATVPTQWLVDSYDMKDGSEPILGYNADNSPIINPASGYDEQKMYLNRDPRFDQTILHHGTTWPLVNKAPQTVNITTSQSWASGYFLVKYLDDRIDHRNNGVTSQNFILMRYAEVLLNYAEAINEASDDVNARTKAVQQLNLIRARAGITKPLIASSFNQNTLRERIRKERRVELCFEEHRFFDIRRWKIAKDVMNRPAIGITIQGGKFVRRALDQRTYNERMDLAPLPNTESNNSPLVKQNPGY